MPNFGGSIWSARARALQKILNSNRLAHPCLFRPDVPAVPPLDRPSDRPLPALPPTNSPSPSLGSKLAAHFAPSRQKLLNLSPRKPVRQSINEFTSDTLSPPTSSSRGTSIDSASSDNRSTTPRPTQPTITVSLPPDNLDGYEGMFTLPTSSSPNVEDSQLTPTSTPTTQLRFPTPQPSDSQTRHQDVDTTIKRRSSRSTADERASSRASRISRKHIGSTFKQFEVDSTDAEDSEAVMSDSPKPSPPMNVEPTPTVKKRRTLATMPYNFSEKASQPRSIMKPSSDRPHRPPAFPPPPPPTNPPSSALPVLPPSQTTSRKSNGPPLAASVSRRQRAQTLSTVPSSITSSPPTSSLATVPSRRITKSIGEGSTPTSALTKKVTEEASGKENFDMDKASADQLRQALTLRNQQFDELASYLLKLTEAHVAEKHALLKKVASLEQEATRRENEIKGLTWLITNNRPGSSGSIGMLSNTTFKSTSALESESTGDKPMSAAGKLTSSFRHVNPADDSGAESHQTTSGAEESYRESGPESMWGSGTSGGESSSSSRARKVKRNHTLMSSFYRTPTKSARQGADSTAPMILPYSSSPSPKRSSLSSFGTSPSSSTSSLSLNTALTPATTVTSLGAIPEAAAPATRSQDPVVAAAILATENQREKEERRASRTSNRLSASSTTAPSASASYSANLKRARPPSIAQVLAQSPKMEHGRDKLRSYGTSGSASS